MEVLKTQNLNITVWHNDTFGRNSFLGEVDLDLSEWDFNNTQINEYSLKPRVKSLFLYTVCVYCRSGLYQTCIHLGSILQIPAQTLTPSPSRVVDSRGQMRVALRFLPLTSHSELMTPHFL